MQYGNFRVIREISKGGMAQVYLATEGEGGPEVALKVLLPHVADDREFRLRFAHEVQAHRSLEHDNIVRLHDAGEADGVPWMAMEYMDGPTLKRLLADAKRLPPEIAIFVVTEALRGLAHAHASGVVHRDVKPSNIMLTRAGHVKIADFGIATAETFTRLTQTGSIIGTPAYMSPEQARGEHADKRTDLFAMGVILYEALVGKNPFLSEHPATTLKKVIEARQVPLFEINPAIPPELEAVVDNLLEKRIALRYQEADEVLRDLETVRSSRVKPFASADMSGFLVDARAEASRLDKEAAEEHFKRGIDLYREGRGSPEKAIWELYQAVVIDPTHEPARNALEIVAHERGFRLQASDSPDVKALRDKLEQDPGNAAVLVQLAKAYKKEGNFLQVIRCYIRLKKLQLKDPYLNNQMNTLVGVDNLDAFDRTRSLVARRQALDPTGVLPAASAAPGLAVPGQRLRLPPRPYEEKPAGESFLRSVLTPQVILALGAVIVVGLVVRTLVGGEKQEQLVRPGELAADIGDAVGELAPAGPSGPEDEATALLRRAAEMIGGQPGRTEEMCRRFVDKFSGHDEVGAAYLLLARAIEAQGRRDEAIAATDQGLRKMKPQVLKEAHLFRAKVHEAMGRIDEAVAEYQAVQALNDPEASPACQLEIVMVLRKAGRQERALEEADKLVGFYPKWRRANEASLLLADLLIAAGRGPEAEPVLARVKASTSIESPEYKRAEKLEGEAKRPPPAAEGEPAGEASTTEAAPGAAEAPGPGDGA